MNSTFAYEATNLHFKKMLKNLQSILEKSSAFADSKKVDFSVLMQSRLAPDMFPLVKQIQITCDTAKLGGQRLTDKAAPQHADDEVTYSDLQKRIQDTLTYLDTLNLEDYSSYASKKITNPRWNGQHMTGHDFAINHMIPNFYFHMTTAYAILRHNGLDIGKKDYLGPQPLQN